MERNMDYIQARDLLWELLPEYIEKNVLEVRDD